MCISGSMRAHRLRRIPEELSRLAPQSGSMKNAARQRAHDLDRAGFPQFCNFLPTIAEQFSEYCFTMLAQFGGTATGIARRFAQAYRHTHQLSLARYWMVIIDDVFISLYLRVV